MNTIRQLFMVSRPISWINTAFPFTAGYIVLMQSIDLRLVIGTLFFLIPYNLLMYGVNDVFDYESDIRNPRKGGIEGAKTAKQFHTTVLWSAVISTLLFVVPLLILCDIESNLVLSAVIFFVVAYSIPKLRYKERPFIDSLTSSMHFVGPLLFALAIAGFPASAWWLVGSFFVWSVASHAFGAVQDIIPDRAGGLRSIATQLGATWTVRFAWVCYLLSSVLLLPYGWPVSLLSVIGLMYAFNILPYLSVTDAKSDISNIAWRRFIYLNLIAGFAVTMMLIYLYA